MSPTQYPDRLEIRPLGRPLQATVSVPGSKSITNRALVLAAFSPRCTLTGALRSEDTAVMIDCLRKLGWQVQEDWNHDTIEVWQDTDDATVDLGKFIRSDLFVGNSGTTIRFLTAMLSVTGGRFRLDGVPRMRERPIGDLLDALTQLGVDAKSEKGNACPPVLINSRGISGGRVRLRADKSSQFLSGLLLALPFATRDTAIDLDGETVSEPYIDLTVRLVSSLGIRVDVRNDGREFIVPGKQRYGGGSIAIEPDASAASYFWAA